MIRCASKMNLSCAVVGNLILFLVTASSVCSQAQQSPGSANCGLPPSYKVDEYGTIKPEEVKKRLEKLLIALGAEKDGHAFIVAYGGRSSSKYEAQSRADWAKRYLVEKQTFYAGAEGTNAHINTLTCGYREVPSTEFWITPVGAAPPRCTPTISAPVRPKPRVRRPGY